MGDERREIKRGGRKEVKKKEERQGKENIKNDKGRLCTERKAETVELRQYKALVERREKDDRIGIIRVRVGQE